MEIIIIAAMTASGVIGKGNKMPWNIPSEQRFFKHTTWSHPVIMGRKTFESIGRPLPGRKNIVLSSQKALVHPDITQYNSLKSAIDRCAVNDKVFIIGGCRVYQESLEIADSLLLTLIDTPYDGDTYFPSWDQSKFILDGQIRVLDKTPYTIMLYLRKSN